MLPVKRSRSRDVLIELADDPGSCLSVDLAVGTGDPRGLGVAVDTDMRLERIRGAAGRVRPPSGLASVGDTGMLRRTLPVGVGGATAAGDILPLTLLRLLTLPRCEMEDVEVGRGCRAGRAGATLSVFGTGRILWDWRENWLGAGAASRVVRVASGPGSGPRAESRGGS